MRPVMAGQYVSEGHFDESAEGAANWWHLLEKVAIIVIVGLNLNTSRYEKYNFKFVKWH